MPFINVKTNAPFNKGRELKLKSELGEAISLIPGKSESWLMIGVDQQIMYFKGSNEPAAIAEISVYGNPSKDSLDKLTAKVTEILAEQLTVKPDRIYVSYFSTPNWGWNGSNF
ncbi:Macrophage migration inhibitory factor (MIF) [Ruminococcus sp. YE71]|uniref:phenylpyruvate tautomerase MIF-related protein n=1 Tax=unclassified Ruminococcus TaxID=2608920 RepID=UPI000891317A|nr:MULTISPECIES: phenylpyruvate tautomerase MIF-related protein [unclassified Ruminococcus]SDA31809.1 Macrophage migration inhibitory factor (MIF) [Ruminococcus sp. YE78]SFW51882.1 Macrophage migration inhibitory factor (MIF) [Ruminococcus sp. YE71]